MLYTCNTCSLQFPLPEDQRTHMKSEWHRYNLKRRVAGLPAIEETLFNEKVQKMSNVDEEEAEEAPSKQKQLTKKEQRRKEKEALLEKKKQILDIAKQKMMTSMQNGELTSDKDTTEITEGVQNLKVEDEKVDTEEAQERNENETSTEQQTTEETTEQSKELTEEEEIEKLVQEKLKNQVVIPPEVCLFCNKKFPYFDACCTHMLKNHGFYIPEPKYLTDKEGLVKYMAEKIGVGNVCIVCNYEFRSLEAVRAHMLSKKHSRIPYESENEKLEISEFYDFTSTYADLDGEENEEDWEDEGSIVGSDEEEEDEVLPQQVSYTDGVELHLPTGIKVGHRALARYYRQNLKPETVLTEGQGTIIAAESRHLATVYDRKELMEKKRVWKNEKHHQDRDDRRAAKFVNNQPHYRDQLLQ